MNQGTQPPAELARAGWRWPLAAAVTAGLLIEAITGLWLYLAPFSRAAELQALLHSVAGLALVVPCLWYLWRHLQGWFRQTVTVVMVLGYGLLVSILTCLASGLVVTWQGLFALRLSPVWDLVHLVSGIAVTALIALHVLLAFARRAASLRHDPALAAGMRLFAKRNAGALASAALVVVVAALAWPRPAVEFPPPDDYTLPAYAQEFDEYRGNPFAPTYARTASGNFVEPAVLSGSASCGTSGCHQEILDEWLPSAHRFSAMNPPFQQVQKNFAEDREPAETRYCAGCHDPISLFAGAKDIHNLELSAPGMQEGSSCVVCHSISAVDQRGNADYVLTPPHKYLWEGTDGWRKLVSDFLIRTYPRQHLADYDRNLLRTPEFCGACHKQFIPEALNRFGLSPGQNQYDEWRKSHWHTDDPETDLSCRDCHMRLVRNSRDPGRGEAGDVRRAASDGAHRHHGMVATNVLIPEVMKLENWEKHLELTREWIRGETVIEEIAHLWPEGTVAPLTLIAPDRVKPGEEVSLRVLVMNKKVGHNLTTGPLDFMRLWLHVRIEDAAGTLVAEWGAVNPVTRAIEDEAGIPHRLGNSRKQGTLVLEGQPVDADGNPLVRHELWEKAGGEGQRVIFPRYSDNQVYTFTVPDEAASPLTVDVDLNFRRYRQQFLDLVVPEMERESGVLQPTVTQSSASKDIEVVGSAASLRPVPR